MPVSSFEHTPPSSCLKGTRALLGLSRARAAEALGIKLRVLAAAEMDEPDTNAIETVMSAYRRIDVAVNVAPQAWIVTRPLIEGEAQDVAYGLATAAARTAAGFTQQMLATSAGVSLRTVIALEQGGGAMRATQDAIATALLRRDVEVVNPAGRWGFKLNLGATTAEADRPGESQTAGGSSQIEALRDFLDTPHLMRLRVEIEGTKPLVWREILIPENATFEDLHRTIQVAFGWRDEHFHEFDVGLRIGPASLNEDGSVMDGKVVDERLAWLYDLSTETRSFVYTYDFGDCWRHNVRIDGVQSPVSGSARPVVAAGGCAGPVESSGSSGGWNALASSLRSKSASRDDLNNLQRSGYGRDYDPDRFDLDAANRHLAGLAFQIGETWTDTWKLRKQIKVAAPFLRPPASIDPPPGRAANKSAEALTVIAVEPFGDAGYEAEGLGQERDPGLAISPSRKMGGRPVQTRSDAGQLLGNVLEYAPDVVSYGGFPIRVRYSDGVNEATLIPDYEVSLANGRKIFVQVVTEQNIHLLNEYLHLRPRLASLGHTLAILPSGLFEASEVKVAYEIGFYAPRPWQKPDTAAAEFIAGILRDRRTIPVKDAVRLLLEHGFAEVENMTGSSENRVLYRILSCVASGAISIDASIPDVRSSVIGAPEVFAGTMSFGRLVEEADIRSAPAGGGKAKGRKRSTSRA